MPLLMDDHRLDNNSEVIDLNRPLPQIPTQSSSRLHSKPSSKDIASSKPPEQPQSRHTRSFSTPTANIKKQNPLNLTCNSLHSSTPQYSPRTTDRFGLLDPVKYSPSEGVDKTSKMPGANNSYQDRSDQLRDEQMQELYNGAKQHGDAPYHINTSMNSLFNDSKSCSPVRAMDSTPQNGFAKHYRKSPGMSQSLSENDFLYRRYGRDPAIIRSPTKFEMKDLERDSPLHVLEKAQESSADIPRRGRPGFRTPSPVKLEDIREGQPMEFQSSPVRRSRSPVKQLFGEHGWLGRSTSLNEMPSEEYRKHGLKLWRGKLKQAVGMMTEDVSKLIHHYESPTKKPLVSANGSSTFLISLGPPVQAKLYSEIELMLCATANQYLVTQRMENRMSLESIAKITDFWTSKNRPQVIEFMFDQATQRDLVLYNLKTFRFYGPNAENPISMNAMMLAWKALAKEMSVRTFCQPDSAVRKHMHDCYKILEMLGAPLVTFLAFQEIQVKALKLIKEKQQQREEYENIPFGVELRWSPPPGKISSESEMDNPFL